MNELLKILQGINPDVDYEVCDTLIDDEVLDSFDIVNLVSEIDDVFGVQIRPVHITPENFNSMEAIYSLIQENLDK